MSSNLALMVLAVAMLVLGIFLGSTVALIGASETSPRAACENMRVTIIKCETLKGE